MKTTYEAWEEPPDEGAVGMMFATVESVNEMRSRGLVAKDAKLLFTVVADTFEEAMAVFNIKMGWGPYTPEGKARECPRGCGAMFYPEGSGECPNCGKIC